MILVTAHSCPDCWITRARVALEERGQFLPGWLLRYLFRPFIGPIIRKLKLAAAGDRFPTAT